MFGLRKKNKDGTMTDPEGITILHDGGPDPQVDIVAIHGLNGGSESTWVHTSDDKNVLWLRDFLPDRYPRCRMMTYGFNANGFCGSVATIRTHSRYFLENVCGHRDEENETARPIIFIAHSLGGLIVKRALIDAEGSAHFSALHKATYGILFFGTPHRGSSTANFVSVLGRIAAAVINNIPPTLIEELKTNSETLNSLSDSFSKQKFHIVSFFEALPTFPLNDLIVDESSAKIGLDEEYEKVLQMNRNHRNLCKFPGTEDVDFWVVSKNIGRFVRAAINATAERAAERAAAGRDSTETAAVYNGGNSSGNVGLLTYQINLIDDTQGLRHGLPAIAPSASTEVFRRVPVKLAPKAAVKLPKKANNSQALKDEKAGLERQCHQLKQKLGDIGKKRQRTELERANFKARSREKGSKYIENEMNKYANDLRRLEHERVGLESTRRTATARIQVIETTLHSSKK